MDNSHTRRSAESHIRDSWISVPMQQTFSSIKPAPVRVRKELGLLTRVVNRIKKLMK